MFVATVTLVVTCELVTMPEENNTTSVSSEISDLKEMVMGLGKSVAALTKASGGRPSNELAAAKDLTEKLKLQERSLKRERDCPPAKQGVVKQQNLLDEVVCKVRLVAAAIDNVKVLVAKDEDASLEDAKPIEVEEVPFKDTTQGMSVLAAVKAAEDLLNARLLDLSVVRAASTNRIGWATVEALSGTSWRDLCEDDKHASNVRDALAEQEKLASAESAKAQKAAENKVSRRAFRPSVAASAPSVSGASLPSYYGSVPPPPPNGGPPSAGPRAASAGMAARSAAASAYHAANDFCYKCQQPGHRSMNCPNPPAPGRF